MPAGFIPSRASVHVGGKTMPHHDSSSKRLRCSMSRRWRYPTNPRPRRAQASSSPAAT